MNAVESLADGVCGVSVGGIEEMGVGPAGDARIGVAETARDGADADTLGRQGGGGEGS